MFYSIQNFFGKWRERKVVKLSELDVIFVSFYVVCIYELGQGSLAKSENQPYSIQLTLCLFLFLVFQQMNRHRYMLSETYRRCLSPVPPSQLHTTLPLLAEGSLLRRLIITCPTFGLFLWIPVRARSARWIFPGKNWVKLILVAVNTTTSFPGFSPTAQGRAGKNPGIEFVNIRLSALLSLCS